MKKILLLACALPCLLTAQEWKSGTGKPSAQRPDGLTAKGGIVLRAGTANNLPDSTYTYYNGKLHQMVGIEYDDKERVVRERGYSDFDFGGYPDDDLKIEYKYSAFMPVGTDEYAHELLVQDAISYRMPYGDGVWHEYSRNVGYYNANGIPVKTLSSYYRGEGGPWDGVWERPDISVALETDASGNPTVVVDSIPGTGGMRAVARFEIAYDAQGRFDEVNTFFPDETGGWRPGESITMTYDGNGNRFDMHFELDEKGQWMETYFFETLYDEQGNMIAETEKERGADGEYHVVWSDTYRHVYSGPSPVAPVKAAGSSSAVYPNPSSDCVTVSLRDAENALVTIVALTGQTVVRQSIGQQATIALSSLPRGIYLLTVKTSGGTDVHKLIVR